MTLEDEFVDFINERMSQREVQRTALAKHLGVNESQITRMLGPKKPRSAAQKEAEAAKRRLDLNTLEKILHFLGLSISREILVAQPKSYVNLAPLRGTLAHGVWRESDMLTELSIREVPYVAAPEFAQLEHYAYQIIDTHADAKFAKNTYVICVDYYEARDALKDGDLVVVERRNTISGRTRNMVTREKTLRAVSTRRDTIWLLSLTTNKDVEDIEYSPSDENVAVVSLVVGSYNSIA